MSHHAKKHYEDKVNEEVEEKVEEKIEEAEEVETEEDAVEQLSEAEAKESLRKADAEIVKLHDENEKLKKELDEAKNDYLRARADCENVRKRKHDEVRAAFDDGRSVAIEKILPIGDSLDWALKMPLDDNTKDGIEKLLKKYHETLVSLGVTEFSPEVGSVFDPNVANAVMTVPKENENDVPETVKQVYGRGYKLGEKIMRYAQVSVIKE